MQFDLPVYAEEKELLVHAEYSPPHPGTPMRYGKEGLIDWGTPPDDAEVDFEIEGYADAEAVIMDMYPIETIPARIDEDEYNNFVQAEAAELNDKIIEAIYKQVASDKQDYLESKAESQYEDQKLRSRGEW